MKKRNYNDKDYSEFRKSVLKRDKYKCQMPSCNSRKKLNVHHIKPWSKAASLRYDPLNGITLCKECHESITGKENHYEVVFTEIIHNATKRT
jgi:5-methylcytosine-specific restriction endonuclease McrA